MLFRLSTVVALSVALFTGNAAAAAATAQVCPVCPASIVYKSITRTLTGTLWTASAGIIQCNYDNPSIVDFNPYCLYERTGALYLTNTAATLTTLPGSCSPTATTVVTTATSC